MPPGLLCQTDETPDARELYAAELEACDACAVQAVTRGAAMPAPMEDEPGGITWLVRAALATDGEDIRRRPALASSPAAARKLPRQQG